MPSSQMLGRIPALQSTGYETNSYQQWWRIDAYGMNFGRHILGSVVKDPRTKNREGSNMWSKPETRPWPRPNSYAKH